MSSWNIKALDLSFVCGSVALFCIWSAGVQANDKRMPLPNFFNASLLNPGESQIGLFGLSRYGAADDLEVGSHALLLLSKQFNVSIKHKMFETEESQTAFTSETLIGGAVSGLKLYSLYGVVNTRPIWDGSHFLTLGLLDGFLNDQSKGSDLSVHLLTPMLAFDSEINPSWFVTFILTKPVYSFGNQASSEQGDGKFDIDLIKAAPSLGYSMLYATYKGEAWSIEFGALSFALTDNFVIPYLNFYRSFRVD